MKDPLNQSNLQHSDIGQTGVEFWKSIKIWFQDLVNLEEGMDRDGTVIFIKNNLKMRGANAWLLMCSIMIASLGLDLNSPAVIIGAMLISPLMSPILGIGLGVGINDRDVLYSSLRHFGIALLIALVTSTIYFWATPFGDFTNEINARTQPTLLDGLVAVFGGFAGIISVTRMDKSNAIPGVAIATALMPPVCVSGYGIANAEWSVMLNAFYLFFLNSFFIATTTLLIIRFLRFPYHEFLNQKEKRRTQIAIVLFSIIMIVPSAIILSNVLKTVHTKKQIEKFTKKYFTGRPQVLNYQYEEGDSSNLLFITLIGKAIHPDSMDYLYEGLKEFNIQNTQLALIQDNDPEIQELNKLQNELNSFKTVAKNLELVNKVKSEKEIEIEVLRAQLDSLKADTIPFVAICNETKAIFKDIEKIGFATAQTNDFQQHIKKTPIVLLRWNKQKQRNTIQKDEEKLYEFLKLRAKLDTLELVRY